MITGNEQVAMQLDHMTNDMSREQERTGDDFLQVTRRQKHKGVITCVSRISVKRNSAGREEFGVWN
jgi:hypothetical protein